MVYAYWRKWNEPDEHGVSGVGAGFKKIRLARPEGNRGATAQAPAVDAQSVKHTDTAGQKGYDAGKKVSGIKRHVILRLILKVYPMPLR